MIPIRSEILCCVEELSEKEARGQIETNLFGSLWMIQAVIPLMRNQKSGYIMQVSIIGGVIAFPGLSIYNASKFAMEGICESLLQEVAEFGIKVILIEPGAYATEWSTSSAKHSKPNEAYKSIRETREANAGKMQKGNPAATADAILELAVTEKPPLRIFLGKLSLTFIEPVYNKKLAIWKEWQPVSEKAQG